MSENVSNGLMIQLPGKPSLHHLCSFSHIFHRYFKKILYVLCSAPFYTKFVQFPTGQTIPQKIRANSKFYPYFRDAIGAIDGSHIPVSCPAHLRGGYRNRKGFLSQNALFICDFNLKFTYTLTGWEGSATDARVYDDAISTDLQIPPGKYLLADAGYPLRPQLLVPYRGVRYHLAEWSRASQRCVYISFYFYLHSFYVYRPKSKEELFNLRHASARNVVERIFGIVKRRYRILHLPIEYNLDVQARLPAALAALHNFLRINTSPDEDAELGNDESDSDDEEDGGHGVVVVDDGEVGTAATGNTAQIRAEANAMRDRIAQAMWDDYQALIAQRDVEDNESDDDSDM